MTTNIMKFNAYAVDTFDDDPSCGSAYCRITTETTSLEDAAGIAYAEFSKVVVNFSIAVFPIDEDPWSTLTLPKIVKVTEKLIPKFHHPNARYLDTGVYRRH